MLPKPKWKTGKGRTSEAEHPRAACMTSRTRKGRPRKEKNAIKGWSVEGKQHVCKMIGKISQDKQSGICKKWEAMYGKLWAVARQADNVVGDDEDDEAFEMDEAMLYAEV
jgi:hypothetical protein